MKKYKKVIISLDIMTREVYKKFQKFQFLQFKPAEEIWKYYPKTGKGNYNNETMFNEAPILETLLILSHLKKNQKEAKPEYWYNSSLFIYNEELYSIRDNGKRIEKIDLTDTLFISMRESWSHPFFKILEQIIQKYNGKIAKPNMQTMENTGCMNKFYGLNNLYQVRNKYLGDIILPYNLKENEMEIFIQFLKDKIGTKVVFKYDGIQEGKGVIFKDLKRDNSLEEVKLIMKQNKVKGKEVLITPAHKIKREYRCYFTKHGRKKSVFSIKQRINSEDIDVYSKKNIQIYKNISVKWKAVTSESEYYNKGIKIAKDMLKYLDYNTGALEFAETDNGKIVFFEINQMAGPLPFEGEDTDNMNNFYDSIISNIFKY